jgi:hypothetical protein
MECLSDYLYLFTIYTAFSYGGMNSGSSCERTWKTVQKYGSTLLFHTARNENGIDVIYYCNV